jgi:hypothetical protein
MAERYVFIKATAVEPEYIQDFVRGHMGSLDDACAELNRLAADLERVTRERDAYLDLHLRAFIYYEGDEAFTEAQKAKAVAMIRKDAGLTPEDTPAK